MIGGIELIADTLNAKGTPKPPSQFRRGHVTPRAFDRGALELTPTGFSIAFPSRAPIPTPTVYDNRVFVSGGFRSREFYAFNARTGEAEWALDLDDDGPSAAACWKGICVFNTESCTLFAVEAKTGKPLWSWWLGDPLMSAPAVADGRVFASYPAPGLHPQASHVMAAFDARTGAILWQRWIDSDVMSAPVVAGTDLYATTFAGTLYRFSAATGSVLTILGARATSAPTIVGDTVMYSRRVEALGERPAEALVRRDRRLAHVSYSTKQKAAPYLDRTVQVTTAYSSAGVSLDAANGFTEGAPPAANSESAAAHVGQSSVSTLQAFQGSRPLLVGEVAISCMGNEIVATNASTGAGCWRSSLEGNEAEGGFLAAPPISVGGRVLVATLAGHVLQIDPSTGKRERSWTLDSPIRAQPVAHAGWLYVTTDDGRLVGINTGDDRITGWNMWGANAARTGAQ
jgi:Ca-activated chloride channel homolog